MGMGSLPYGKSLVPRPLALLCGLLLIVAAAGAGWFLASKLADEPVPVAPAQSLNVTAGTAALKLREGWQAETRVPRVPGIDATNAKALAPADGGAGRMVVSLVKTDGAAADLPPATLEALRVPLPKPERAALAGLRGSGYPALSLRGVNGLVDLYTFKTVAGLLTISCIAPVDDPLPTGSCPADITEISVSVPQAPDPAARMKAALPRVSGELDKARISGRLALRRGADSDAQAAAARSVSAAYGSAADDIAALAPAKGEGASLPDVFRAAASAYADLGAAAAGHDSGAYTRATAAVNEAELEVATALGALGG